MISFSQLMTLPDCSVRDLAAMLAAVTRVLVRYWIPTARHGRVVGIDLLCAASSEPASCVNQLQAPTEHYTGILLLAVLSVVIVSPSPATRPLSFKPEMHQGCLQAKRLENGEIHALLMPASYPSLHTTWTPVCHLHYPHRCGSQEGGQHLCLQE